eukprot:Sspe_Gene.111176::Locus_92543_Transcript_1_1_Confidence_1.000_Length_1033::g.111176::m.111176
MIKKVWLTAAGVLFLFVLAPPVHRTYYRSLTKPEPSLLRAVEALEVVEDAQRYLELGGFREELIRRMQARRSLTLSFAGYSVMAGRGSPSNYSIPSVVERILSPAFKAAGISLTVRNGAQGGTPSLPAQWCLQEMLGEDSDVVTWMYTYNEQHSNGGNASFESILRHVWASPRQPLFIMFKPPNKLQNYEALLQEYANRGLPSLLVDETAGPSFNKSTTWPPGDCPGQLPWHFNWDHLEALGKLTAVPFLRAILRIKDNVGGIVQKPLGKPIACTASDLCSEPQERMRCWTDTLP